MTCLHYIPLLDDYVDGELAEQQIIDLELHLKKCDSCSDELLETRRLKELLSDQKTPFPSHQYWMDNQDVINARTIESDEWNYPTAQKADNKKIKTEFYRAFVSAAAALCLLGISIVIGSSQTSEFSENNPKASPVFVMNPLENESNVTNAIILTKAEQINQIKGMMLISPPGMLGRLSAMYEYNRLHN